MSKLTIIPLLIILISNNGQATRIITNFDIARWYLDSDVVLICRPYKIDTLNLGHYDSIIYDSTRLTYDIIREVYHIRIDSVIKTTKKHNGQINTIYSQDFSINYAKTKESINIVYSLNSIGDTIGTDTLGIITMFGTDYSDNSYFRLDNGKKHLVILSLTQKGYVIDYESECNENILDLIKEVKSKGESYFPIPLNYENKSIARP